MRRLFGTCGGAWESNDYFFLALAIQHTIQVQWSILKYTWDKTKEAY